MSGETKTDPTVEAATKPPSGKERLDRARITNFLLRNLMALVVIAVAIYILVR